MEVQILSWAFRIIAEHLKIMSGGGAF
jgi:hypothetical protein